MSCFYLAEAYGAEGSTKTMTMINDWVMEGMGGMVERPLDVVHAVGFIGRHQREDGEGEVVNRPRQPRRWASWWTGASVMRWNCWAGKHGDGKGAKHWTWVGARNQVL